MKDRILIVLPNDQLDGAENVLQQIAHHYSAYGYEVDVFFLKIKKFNGWEKMEGKMNLFYTHVNKERFGIIELIKNLRNHAYNKHYAFAYTSHTQLTGIIGFLKARGFLKISKFIGRESTSIFVRFTGWKLMFFKLCYRFGYLQTNLLICQTSFMKSQLYTGMPNLFKKISNIAVIPNPIVYENVRTLSNSARPHPNKYLVAAGRLIREKGFDVLIRAFKTLSAEYPDTDLLILGKGILEKELLLLIDELGLKEKVILVGQVSNVFPYFRHAEACVVSSRVEGFPNVLLQMMSQNKRVISTLCAGDIDLVKGIHTCPPDDDKALGHAINKSLKDPSEENINLFHEQLKERDIRLFINKIHDFLAISYLLPVEIIC